MKNKKIKHQSFLNKGKTVKNINMVEMNNLDYPVFCFRNIHKEYNLDACDDSEIKGLAKKVVQLSQMTWTEIQQAPKHGAGTEKISVKSLNVIPPSFITPDVDFLLAARFDAKKPFLFHRYKFIAHIIFIDPKFKTYGH